MKDNGFTKKIAIVGTGFVGLSFAYALLCEGFWEGVVGRDLKLVLLDINREKAIGEAMDLNHGLAFAKTNMKIYAGEYNDCHDADMIVICAGVSQKPGEDRISLLKRNQAVFESIISPILASGFQGIFLVATNPVDIMTRMVQHLSGFDSARVIGSGTTLDTARLRYLLGAYLSVDPKNVHAYVIGEHGDSEMVPWFEMSLQSTRRFHKTICKISHGKYNAPPIKLLKPKAQPITASDCLWCESSKPCLVGKTAS